MSTTALFAELLVIGLETVVWIALLVSSLFGLNWLSYLRTAFETAGLIVTVALLSLAYLLGIIIDEISDTLTDRWAAHIRASVHEQGYQKCGTCRRMFLAILQMLPNS